MAIPAVIVLLPFGLLFLLSGLVINLVQAILFVLIRPVSRNLYRRINRSLAELLWLQLIWLVDWWAGVQVELYADSETFNLMGKEHALLVSNHRSDIDWLVGWVLAQYIDFNGLDLSFGAFMVGFRGDSTACHYTVDNMPAKLHRSGCLGSALAVMKKSSKFLPVIGWSMWFAEYLFLERNWAKDEGTLKRGLQQLKDFPVPFWLALFVEGTRFTPAKLLAAQEYATTQGIHVPRNVLVPRTKGFVASISILRSFVPAIYDTTVIIPKNQPSPTMMRILRGQSSVVHVHMRRRPMSELPKTDEEVSQWCRDIFVAKDDLLDKHIAEGSFGGEVRSLGRPLKSLLVVTFWSCLLSYGAFRFFKWTQLLATWKGVGFTTLGLVLVTLCMHIFVAFSQAERSSSAKAAKNRVKKE